MLVRAAVATCLAMTSGCGRAAVDLGQFVLSWDRDTATLGIDWQGARILDVVEFAAGTGDATVSFQVGSYRFDDVTASLTTAARLDRRSRHEDAIFVAEL